MTGLLDPGIERHGRRWRTRLAAEARATRATRATQHKGRTPGAKDRAPRRTAPDTRVPEIASALAAVQAGQGPAVTPASLAVRYDLGTCTCTCTCTAERLIAKGRAQVG
ncbi:hypothetical protein PL81_31725 [Streptomyces sp. RSD-27]|nr:hypothetical protein PL81_31725 [Streptomyces sp. RSD-27]